MLNVIAVTRDDFFKVSGGDRVMLEKIQANVRPHGVNISIVLPEELGSSKIEADAVYITQAYQSLNLRFTSNWANDNHLPIFISPLAEYNLPQWFNEAMHSVAYWRFLSTVLGRRNAERVYVLWRYRRRRQLEEWHQIRDVLVPAHLVPNSQYELDHLRKWFALISPRATIVPLGIDASVYSERTSEKSRVGEMCLRDYILEVGSICRRKNQLGLLQACYHRPEQVVILGQPSPYEPDYYAEVASLARKRGNVVLLERVSEQELYDLYANAKVHVLPSWSERPGLVTLEAIVAGCPVVSTKLSSIRDYLGNEVVLCDPRSGDSINKAIDKAISYPPSEGFDKSVLQTYTWGNTGKKFAEMIKTTLQRDHKP